MKRGWSRGREREGDRHRGESRVRQAPRVTRHSASWVGFVPFLSPSRGGGRGIGRFAWGGDSGYWGRESFLGHFTSTSTEIERADIALDLCFKN